MPRIVTIVFIVASLVACEGGGVAPEPVTPARPITPAEPLFPVDACRLTEKAFTGVGLGFPRSTDRLTSIGTVHASVLFADFPDVSAARTPAEIMDILSPVASDYYRDVSYGRMDLVLEPHLEWLRMESPSTDYAEAIRHFVGHRNWLHEAVTLADADVDFSDADIVVVMAAPSAAEIRYGPTWMGFEGAALEADGARITNGITSGADLLHWGGIWLNHEMGHSMSLADLYSYEDQPGFTRPFSLMDLISGDAPEYFAYERWFLGWLDDTQIACLSASEQVSLAPIEIEGGIKAAMVPLAEHRAVVVESRRALGWDADLDREGAVVYVVDTSIQSGHGPIQVLNERNALLAGESVIVENVTIAVTDAADSGDTVQVTINAASPSP